MFVAFIAENERRKDYELIKQNRADEVNLLLVPSLTANLIVYFVIRDYGLKHKRIQRESIKEEKSFSSQLLSIIILNLLYWNTHTMCVCVCVCVCVCTLII